MGFHNLSFRTLVHATEDPDKVEAALRFLVGDGEIKFTRTAGYHGNPIIIMEARLDRRREICSFFEKLEREQIEEILGTLAERMDDEGTLYLRLDKQAAYQGVCRLVTHDDVVSVRGKAESYPKTKEKAAASVRVLLESLLDR